MNRREFIAGLAAAFAAPIIAKIAIPVDAPAKISEEAHTTLFNGEIGRYENINFIESHQYGNKISIINPQGKFEQSFIEKTKTLLIDNARKTLPKGTKFNILDLGERDYGFRQDFAWYYGPRKDHVDMKIICEATA